jgi:hypothetical protein
MQQDAEEYRKQLARKPAGKENNKQFQPQQQQQQGAGKRGKAQQRAQPVVMAEVSESSAEAEAEQRVRGGPRPAAVAAVAAAAAAAAESGWVEVVKTRRRSTAAAEPTGAASPAPAAATPAGEVPPSVQLLPKALLALLQGSSKSTKTAIRKLVGDYAPSSRPTLLSNLFALFKPEEEPPAHRADTIAAVADAILEHWDFIAQKA